MGHYFLDILYMNTMGGKVSLENVYPRLVWTLKIAAFGISKSKEHYKGYMVLWEPSLPFPRNN